MSENNDYIYQFSDSNSAANEAANKEILKILKTGDFDGAKPEIKKILIDNGLDSSSAEFALSSIKDSYDTYNNDTEDLTDYKAYLMAEICDTLTFFFPNKSDEDLCDIGYDIVSAIYSDYSDLDNDMSLYDDIDLNT